MNSEASSESPFHLQPDKPGFEALANDNSFRFWWASELAVILGYESLKNMDLWRLRRHKDVPPGRSPLDFMGKTEMAAEDIKEVHKKLKFSHLENENRLHSGSV